MLKKKELEILLSKLKETEKPSVELEQYMIPSNLAAEILNLAYLSGDIKDKIVLDLGCGSGRLTIGSVLMDAKKVIGVDVDKKSIQMAKTNLRTVEKIANMKIHNRVKFVCQDVSEVKEEADTVIQNPPFGIQKLHADRIFVKKALECAKKVYSLHRYCKRSREFLTEFIEKNGGRIEKIIKFKFRIPYMFKFHKKPQVSYKVDLFIISKV